MRILLLRISFWLKVRLFKNQIELLTDEIVLIAWTWAKVQYDKHSQTMSIAAGAIERLKPYNGVAIQAGEGERQGKRKRTFSLFAWLLIVADGFLYTWGLASLYGYGPLSDINDPGDWFKLLFMSVLLTLASVLGPTEFIKSIFARDIDADKLKYKLPEEQEGTSKVLTYFLFAISLLGIIVTVYIGYQRGVIMTGGKSLYFFLITPPFVAIVAALFKYFAARSGRLYDAYRLKEQYNKLVTRERKLLQDKVQLRARLADRTASIHMRLIIMVRKMLRVSYPITDFPKNQGELRNHIHHEFNATIIDEGYKSPGLGMSGVIACGVGLLGLVSLSSCNGFNGTLNSLRPTDTTYDIKILVDISGSTSDAKWKQYEAGIYNLIKAVGTKAEITAYAIDAAAYTDPGQLLKVDFASGKSYNQKIDAIIRALPDSLKPPFKRRYETDHWTDINNNRVIPFYNRIWPYLIVQMDSIRKTRISYSGNTNIIGALKKVEPEFKWLESPESSAGMKKKKRLSYLFIFSDMVQSSKEGITFERPYGITDGESKHYLETLKADNQIPNLHNVKVVVIGKGVFKGGPLTDESIDNIHTFWEQYFNKTQADLGAYTSLENINNIETNLR